MADPAQQAELLSRLLLKSEERRLHLSRALGLSAFDWDLREKKLVWDNGEDAALGGDTLAAESPVSWLANVHAADRERVSLGLQEAIANGRTRWSDEFRFVARDGTPSIALGRASILCDPTGMPIRVIGALVDITAQRTAEQTLRESATRLQVLVDEAAETDRRKNEFLAMLAHELRNPLAPVRSAVDLLLGHPTPEAAERYIAVIGRQVGRLTHLVDDLLDVSRITRGHIELRRGPVELRELVLRAVESVQHHVTSRRHALTVTHADGPVWVDGDPLRLEQVLANLLVNACKYTDPGGAVDVCVKREDARVAVSVSDTGVGLAPDMILRIFELFGQVPQSMDRRDGGLGIGLTIVKRLVEMHGGTVEAKSRGVGCGSEFIVTLPVIASPATV